MAKRSTYKTQSKKKKIKPAPLPIAVKYIPKNDKRFLAPEATRIFESGAHINPRHKILIVTPTLGIIRIEWAISRWGQGMPTNWSPATAHLGIGNVVPMNYLVADAQNLGCEEIINKDFEWLLLWEDDVIAPIDSLLRLSQHMREKTSPIISGIYFTKGLYSEPILYRGPGTGCFDDFEMGQLVWASGIPTGFLLIHRSIIEVMWDEAPEYATLGKRKTRQVFETVSNVRFNPDTTTFTTHRGTSDLDWCNKVINNNILKKAGWKKQACKKYPLLCDTYIFCKHIDLATGEQFPHFDFKGVGG